MNDTFYHDDLERMGRRGYPLPDDLVERLADNLTYGSSERKDKRGAGPGASPECVSNSVSRAGHSTPATPPSSAAQGRLADALTEALEGVEAPTQLVGRTIPPSARKWAERHGLGTTETEFAPAGQLFIVGAVPVPLWANDLFEKER